MPNAFPVLLLSCVLFGLLAGIPLAVSSHRRQPVRGGILARMFHYLAASAAATTPVAAFITVITQGILTALIVAAGLTGAFYLFAVVYALAERAAHSDHDHTRWTAEASHNP